MLSVLVEVALLKLVIVPEVARLTIPPALLVMPVIAPDPPRLIVPVLVKFASAVVILLVPLMAVVPAFVRVVIEQVPPMFNVYVAALLSVPVPDRDAGRAVVVVIVPLLVSVTPVTTSAVAHVNVPLFV